MGYFEDKNERSNYKSDGPKRRNDSGGDRYDDKKTVTTVNCDACGKTCTVPFKPTAGKPIYCNECFRKNDSAPRGDKPHFNSGSDSRSRSADSGSNSRDFAQINAKLDRILSLLEESLD
jgi:CxxC-x17-CxxC domain-containing protein